MDNHTTAQNTGTAFINATDAMGNAQQLSAQIVALRDRLIGGTPKPSDPPKSVNADAVEQPPLFIALNHTADQTQRALDEAFDAISDIMRETAA